MKRMLLNVVSFLYILSRLKFIIKKLKITMKFLALIATVAAVEHHHHHHHHEQLIATHADDMAELNSMSES